MVDLDWHTLFNTFFSLVRVKVQCKDPSKVPSKRIFVFKGSLYLIKFKTEGFDQIDNPSDDDNNPYAGVKKTDDDDDDLLGDDPPASEAPLENGGSQKSGNGEGSQGGKVDIPPTNEAQGRRSAPAGCKSVKRSLLFGDDEVLSPKETIECADLLGAMELEGDEMDEEELLSISMK
jgi:hypothetical protein